jgi:hypothetical protein
MSRPRKHSAPNVTIEQDPSSIPRLVPDEVPALLDALSLTTEQHRETSRLVAELAAEEAGEQNPARFGAILDGFRAVSHEVYEQVGKPLFITFLRDRRPRSP